MAKNLSVDTHDHDPSNDQGFYDLLSKEAEETGSDDDEGTVGTTPRPEDEDLDRSSGDMDAPWGEKPSEEVVQFSRQAFTKFKENREGVLKKYFDSPTGPGDKAQQAVVSQQLAHAASGDFETSSPQLSDKVKKAIG